MDLYDLLELSKDDCSQDDIKKQYRKMSKAYHPDRHVNSSNSVRKEAEDKFQQFSSAYKILKDPGSKSVYDKYGMDGIKAGQLLQDVGRVNTITFYLLKVSGAFAKNNDSSSDIGGKNEQPVERGLLEADNKNVNDDENKSNGEEQHTGDTDRDSDDEKEPLENVMSKLNLE